MVTSALDQKQPQSKPNPTSLGYRVPPAGGCLEFPSLLTTGSVRTHNPSRPAPKDMKIPAEGPQILRYRREIGRNASGDKSIPFASASIARLQPQLDAQACPLPQGAL